MKEVLSYVNQVMDELAVPYQAFSWEENLHYPYFVGSYTTTLSSPESGTSQGTLTINGWQRGSAAEFLQLIDLIHDEFLERVEIYQGHALAFFCRSCDMIPSGEDGLYRCVIQIDVLDTNGVTND